MFIFESGSPRWNNRMLSLLRIVAGALFWTHGMQKLFGLPPSPVMHVPVPLFSLLGLAAVIETFGGAAILIGLFTRPVAFLLCGEMAIAYFTQHFPRGPIPLANGGELAVLYCFLFLYFVFTGAGPLSVDALIARSARTAAPGEAPRRPLDRAA
jgi:putative oxidoreductase